jgi:hypothetical protein
LKNGLKSFLEASTVHLRKADFEVQVNESDDLDHHINRLNRQHLTPLLQIRLQVVNNDELVQVEVYFAHLGFSHGLVHQLAGGPSWVLNSLFQLAEDALAVVVLLLEKVLAEELDGQLALHGYVEVFDGEGAHGFAS